jgi:hypothetical protein
MIRRREDLYLLIKSLSGAEKRYFRNFSKAFSATGESPLYIQLFDQLDKEDQQHQNQIEKLSDNSLSMTKWRLYDTMLKSLRLFHQDKHIGIVIMNLLADVQILYNLGLAAQALFQLQKAYKLSVEYELFDLLLETLEWESTLNVVLEKETRSQDAILKEEREVLGKQIQLALLKTIYGKAERIKKKYGFVKGPMVIELKEQTVKSTDMPVFPECLSKKAEYYYNFIQALYHWMTFDHQKAYTYSEKLLHPESRSISPGDYINGLLEHITCCVCLCRFDEALEGLKLGMASIEEKNLTQSHVFTARMFAYQSTYKLIIYSYQGDKVKLLQEIRHTEEKLKEYEHPLPFERKQVIIGNLMNAYMAIGEQEKADQIWAKMFNKHSKEVRQDIYADLYLFRLFSLLQTKTYVLIPSAALSAIRYFKKTENPEQQFELELPIAQLLQKDHDYSKAALREELFNEIKKIISRYIKKISPKTGFQEHYSRYQIWINAIQKERPYVQEAAAWYKHYKESRI